MKPLSCIYKGAEATVVNWQTTKGPEGQQSLIHYFKIERSTKDGKD